MPHDHRRGGLLRRLLIVQPYIPSYRVPFFSGLVEALRRDSVDVRVIAPAEPLGTQGARGDAASGHPWHVVTRASSIRVGHRRLTYYGSFPHLGSADGVIAPAAGSCLDSSVAIARAAIRPLRVGIWGHIADYVQESSRIDNWLERRLLLRADHVFAYTAFGARTAVEAGVNASRVTTLNNTVDTRELRGAVASLDEKEIQAFRARHSVSHHRVFAYVGGVDSSKRPEFLAKALDALWAIDPDIRLLLAGTGSHISVLDSAVERGQVHLLGVVGPRELALIGAVSEAFLMPGRIGLVAVDALTLGLPLITTDYKFHAPEIAYLEEGVSVFSNAHSPLEYARLVSGFKRSDTALPKAPDLSEMIAHFERGVGLLLR